ncbi:VanZ family protein [Candidatus Enterococcus mangumiae]|uniref:VanZ-like domain-containing protein n=1 Tax=Candidatus Enterococcus mangumiae TaxID=2230878 RepID=A0ABZ2ST11_9ENTE|nr:VanZ family protein [Enterococcus sp. DIV1094]MBO0490928.1 VanZ family protein [Enterococcus sp. DIV1094]
MIQQIGFWESIIDILTLKPVFLVGLLILASFLFWFTKKNKGSFKLVSILSALLLFYYMCVTFFNVFGVPTLYGLNRISGFGENIFNPNINLVPFIDGINTGYILNIICFIPIGFLCPLISPTYRKFSYSLLFGFCTSLLIELSQLFTVARATDIDDLTSNVLGMILGYCLIQVILKMFNHSSNKILDKTTDISWSIPVFVVFIAFINTFFS